MDILNAEHIKKRFNFALEHGDPNFNWSKTIFTDEKKFNLDGPDGYKNYWHFEGMDKQIYSKDKNARKSVHVWGGIWEDGKTCLVDVPTKMNSKKYIEILDKGLLPSYEKGDTFEYDGAKVHTSKETMGWLKSKKIKGYLNPPKSPYLSPIENVWAYMAKEVYYGKDAYKSVDTLKDAVYEAWESVPKELLKNLVKSMPNRMLEVIEKKGARTHY